MPVGTAPQLESRGVVDSQGRCAPGRPAGRLRFPARSAAGTLPHTAPGAPAERVEPAAPRRDSGTTRNARARTPPAGSAPDRRLSSVTGTIPALNVQRGGNPISTTLDCGMPAHCSWRAFVQQRLNATPPSDSAWTWREGERVSPQPDRRRVSRRPCGRRERQDGAFRSRFCMGGHARGRWAGRAERIGSLRRRP